MRPAALLASLTLALVAPAFADSMRCGKWVVNEQSSPAELAEKCGEPQRKDVTKEDVLGKNAAGFPIKHGVKVTERWYYQRSTRSLPMLVTVVDGKVISIERAD